MSAKISCSDNLSVIDKKIERLQRGVQPRVLDLFAGCGGISLGFHSAGFKIEAAIELDGLAANTHAKNFHGSADHELFAQHAKSRDITQVEPDELVADLNLGPAEDAFDVLVGGPPCQAYARVGRAKLRDVAEHPEAFKIDPRGNLYLRYLHYVEAMKPLALLMENVPDVLNYGGHNVMGEIAEALDEIGYSAKYSLINSAFHGVPQMRDRVFLMAYRKELDVEVSFPLPTNHMQLPSGYGGTRSVALRLIDMFESGAFISADHGTSDLPPPISCEAAIGDLPRITIHLEGKLKRGARRFTELTPYPEREELSGYAKMMRGWTGFENTDGVFDHVIRYLPRDGDIFREMPNGSEYPEAHKTAEKLWNRKIHELETQTGLTLSPTEREELHRKMVPPYPVGSFPNRWWKLRRDFPARTLMAHIGKDTYSHIHYDSSQARVISVREAARLQSFPDGFVFSGTMNPAYRQIGNAVPPLMARALARVMIDSLAASAKAGGRAAA